MPRTRCPSHFSSISLYWHPMWHFNHIGCLVICRARDELNVLPVLMSGWPDTEVTLGHVLSSRILCSLVLSLLLPASGDVSVHPAFPAEPCGFGSAPGHFSRTAGWLFAGSCADAPGDCFTLRLCSCVWDREEASAPCWPRRAKLWT